MISMLWLPYVIYDNTDMKEAVQLVDGLDTTVVIAREGSFTRPKEKRSSVILLTGLERHQVFRGFPSCKKMSETVPTTRLLKQYLVRVILRCTTQFICFRSVSRAPWRQLSAHFAHLWAFVSEKTQIRGNGIFTSLEAVHGKN